MPKTNKSEDPELSYTLKLKGKKEAEQLVRAYRALHFLQAAQRQFPELVED
jgi:hypothetical protein